jgi:hypothetical protein
VKRSLLCTALLVGAFIALDETAAIETVIDDTKIELVVPTGYCPLDRKDWPESRPIDFTSDGIKKQGERLAYLVDCERARSWREGGSSKDVGHVVDYQASLELRSRNVTRAMLEELCATLRTGDDSSKGWVDMFLTAMKSIVMGKYGGAEDITLSYVVLRYQHPACYVFRLSLMMKNREQVYTVSALTAVKSKLVIVHRSRKIGTMDLLKGDAEDVIKRLLVTSKETATALIAANQ